MTAALVRHPEPRRRWLTLVAAALFVLAVLAAALRPLRRLYVARRNSGDIAELNPDTGAMIRVVAAGFSTNIRALATDPLTGTLAASDNAGEAVIHTTFVGQW